MRNQVLLPFINAWLKAQGFSSAPESVFLNAIVFLCVITGDIISWLLPTTRWIGSFPLSLSSTMTLFKAEALLPCRCKKTCSRRGQGTCPRSPSD